MHLNKNKPIMSGLNKFGKEVFEEVQPTGSSKDFVITTVVVHGTEFLVKMHNSMSSISFIQKYGNSIYSKSIFLEGYHVPEKSFKIDDVFVPSMDTLFFQMKSKNL